ncbi:multiheme c-type cytochrome [candidate division KSB1 bacterium]
MKPAFTLFILMFCLVSLAPGAEVSEDTEVCLTCHNSISPGIVADWERSRHSKVSPAEALEKSVLERRISAQNVPEKLLGTSVGCAECHQMNPDSHADTFDHAGYPVHVVVSPADCAVCHPVERSQYEDNLMSQAYGNLKNNPVYHGLVKSVNGLQSFDGMELTSADPDPETDAESCFYCHGTVVEVTGTETRETDLGEMEFPVLSGWPNQGVGRINPDGSKGSCSACHARHRFSIEMARKPYTCAECHSGPDVPAYKVYQVSKHGNIHSSEGHGWDFESVPWVVGEDFTAPTCATCHVSLITTPEGETVLERSHAMNDRLAWRIFGLPYAHPHPIDANTNIIKNKAGLPLPTELTGEPVQQFLIDREEQAVRTQKMQKVCLACHGRSWVDGQFRRLERTIQTTNAMTLTATQILLEAWNKGLASGLPQGEGESIFDEAIEKKWVEQWLFYANSTRFASAMCGADYGAFANGRWYMSRNVREMQDWVKIRSR